jgi:hypothetical protein
MSATEELIERWRSDGIEDNSYDAADGRLRSDIRKLADALKVGMTALEFIDGGARWLKEAEDTAQNAVKEIDRICEGETSV